MFKKLLLPAALLCVSGLAGGGETRIIEEALELSGHQVQLPSSAGGNLYLRRCAECAPERFRLGSTAAFFVGQRPVSLSELRLATRSSSPVYVFYHAQEGHVTRIIIGRSNTGMVKDER